LNVEHGVTYSKHWALKGLYSLEKSNFCDNNTRRTDNCMEYAAYGNVKVGGRYSS